MKGDVVNGIQIMLLTMVLGISLPGVLAYSPFHDWLDIPRVTPPPSRPTEPVFESAGVLSLEIAMNEARIGMP